jgi:hypothetical protein
MRVTNLVATCALPVALCAQGTFCSPQGNVALFSNYDGGALTIRVDQDIPDLHIGIVSYEYATITITGPYAGNVVAVHYAGYNGTNDHCDQGSLVFSTSITGVDASIAEIELYPAATYPNTNGWPNIICAYSCDIATEQGGCNTVDQVAHYFLDMWNGVLLFHRTQYGCWDGTWNISDGGNCCVDPLETAMTEAVADQDPLLVSNVVEDMIRLHRPAAITVWDEHGRLLRQERLALGAVPVSDLPMGVHFLRDDATGRVERFVVVR